MFASSHLSMQRLADFTCVKINFEPTNVNKILKVMSTDYYFCLLFLVHCYKVSFMVETFWGLKG